MRSDEIKKGVERAPHRALLKALGLTDSDIAKPFIAIANSYTNIVPGHTHLQQLANAAKRRHTHRRRHTLRIQHHSHLRRPSHGTPRHALLTPQPRTNRRHRRNHDASTPLRRHSPNQQLRQSHSRHAHGSSTLGSYLQYQLPAEQ